LLDLFHGQLKSFQQNVPDREASESIVFCHVPEALFALADDLRLAMDLAAEHSDPNENDSHDKDYAAKNLQGMRAIPP